MRVEINFHELKKNILLAEKVAGRHMTLPVLSCIVLEAKNNTLSIKATNIDLGIEVFLPTKNVSGGKVAIPATIIASFLSQTADYDGVATLESNGNVLQIKTAKSKGNIKTVPHDDFPDIPTVKNGQKTNISPEMITKGLKSVWYSASVSSVKPELSSVYIHQKENQIVFASTDSFRLAEKVIKTSGRGNLNDVLIPFKNIADIIRILDSINEETELDISKNLISFEVPQKIKITSRAIDGVFPDYKQIIPKGYETEIVVLKQDLLNALKISNVFSDQFNQIHFLVDPKNKVFELHTKNNDIGENKTSVDATVTGEKIEINFNYKYIADCFQSIDSDSLSLKLSGSNKPMVINPVSGEQTFTYLVMPMNR